MSQVIAMHFLGMAGHFGLGNSNSLATVDVAGAFIVNIISCGLTYITASCTSYSLLFPVESLWHLIISPFYSTRVSQATRQYFLAFLCSSVHMHLPYYHFLAWSFTYL